MNSEDVNLFFFVVVVEKSKHENSSQPTPKHHHHWGISRLYKWDCTNSYELPSLPKHQIVTNCFVIVLALVVLLMKNSDHACWKIQVYWTTGSRHTEIWEPISHHTVWKHKIDKIIDKKNGNDCFFFGGKNWIPCVYAMWIHTMWNLRKHMSDALWIHTN